MLVLGPLGSQGLPTQTKSLVEGIVRAIMGYLRAYQDLLGRPGSFGEAHWEHLDWTVFAQGL